MSRPIFAKLTCGIRVIVSSVSKAERGVPGQISKLAFGDVPLSAFYMPANRFGEGGLGDRLSDAIVSYELAFQTAALEGASRHARKNRPKPSQLRELGNPIAEQQCEREAIQGERHAAGSRNFGVLTLKRKLG